jgi:K(+)-stimulated pyrophosphate-energized sodium pump
MDIIVYLSIAAGVLALLFAAVLFGSISKVDAGTDRMKEIASYIQEGAMAFLTSEYKYIIIFVAVLFLVLGFTLGFATAACFVVGAFLSAFAGFLGMRSATKANVRTASEARKGLSPALKVAFRGGSVMGLCVVGLGIIGVSVCYLIFQDATILTGFGLGASRR